MVECIPLRPVERVIWIRGRAWLQNNLAMLLIEHFLNLVSNWTVNTQDINIHFSNGTVPGGKSSFTVPAAQCSTSLVRDIVSKCCKNDDYGSSLVGGDKVFVSPHPGLFLPFSARTGTLSSSW